MVFKLFLVDIEEIMIKVNVTSSSKIEHSPRNARFYEQCRNFRSVRSKTVTFLFSRSFIKLYKSAIDSHEEQYLIIRQFTRIFFRKCLHTIYILSTYCSTCQVYIIVDMKLIKQKCVLCKYNYNIPRACLLNRSPVPAMDLKSNRSGL